MCVLVSAVAPVVSEAIQIQAVRVGSEVVMGCGVRGEEYDATWTMGKTIIASSNGTSMSKSHDNFENDNDIFFQDGRYTVLSNNSLVINTSRHSNSGCYTCTASNRAGSVKAKVQLIVTDDGRPTLRAVTSSLCDPISNSRTDNSSSSPACLLATDVVTTTTEGCKVLRDMSREEGKRSSVETIRGGQSEVTFLHYVMMTSL